MNSWRQALIYPRSVLDWRFRIHGAGYPAAGDPGLAGIAAYGVLRRTGTGGPLRRTPISRRGSGSG